MPPDPLTPAPKDTTVSEPSTLPPPAVEAPASDPGSRAELTTGQEFNLPPVIDTPVAELTAVSEQSSIHDTARYGAGTPINTIAEPIAQTLDSASSPQETAQIPANEPLKAEPIPLEPTVTQAQPASNGTKSRARELLAIARNAMQFRKRKKLEKILSLLEKRASITNDEVEKLLHVSDATATRYLSTLEKEGKIKQTGKTGKSVSYSKI